MNKEGSFGGQSRPVLAYARADPEFFDRLVGGLATERPDPTIDATAQALEATNTNARPSKNPLTSSATGKINFGPPSQYINLTDSVSLAPDLLPPNYEVTHTTKPSEIAGGISPNFRAEQPIHWNQSTSCNGQTSWPPQQGPPATASCSATASLHPGLDFVPLTPGKRKTEGTPQKESSKQPKLANGARDVDSEGVFPCPYGLYDPTDHQRYDSCHGIRFKDMRRVRGHLLRHHLLERMCHRCHHGFSSPRELEEHRQAGPEVLCTPSQKSTSGVSKAQWQALSNRKAFYNMADLKKWEEFCKILFPNREPLPPNAKAEASRLPKTLENSENSKFDRRYSSFGVMVCNEAPGKFRDSLSRREQGRMPRLSGSQRDEVVQALEEVLQDLTLEYGAGKSPELITSNGPTAFAAHVLPSSLRAEAVPKVPTHMQASNASLNPHCGSVFQQQDSGRPASMPIFESVIAGGSNEPPATPFPNNTVLTWQQHDGFETEMRTSNPPLHEKVYATVPGSVVESTYDRVFTSSSNHNGGVAFDGQSATTAPDVEMQGNEAKRCAINYDQDQRASNRQALGFSWQPTSSIADDPLTTSGAVGPEGDFLVGSDMEHEGV